MNDRNNYKKKQETQARIIERQSETINSLKTKIEELELECIKKDETINSVYSLKKELEDIVKTQKKYRDEYNDLIHELKKMKEIMNQSVYKGRWNLVKLLIK